MGQQEHEQDRYTLTNEQGFNLVYFAAEVGFWTLAPFLRSGMGRRAGGVPMLLALVVLLLIVGRMHSQAMLFYFWAWVGMGFYRRLTPGKDVLSIYQGWPFTTAWLVRKEMLARLAEIPLVFAAGAYLEAASPALGKFLMWASLALAVKYWIESAYLRRLDETIEDEMIWMQTRMERLKRR